MGISILRVPEPALKRVFPLRDYDLAATLDSRQAFRWTRQGDAWTGVIRGHGVRLRSDEMGITAETWKPVSDWQWLVDYLQLDVELERVLMSFPADEPMQSAVRTCRGLRLLRQDPWECLASFILSSTKQIVQIRQIIGLLCRQYGEPLAAGPCECLVHNFPNAERLARLSEKELRQCKMGFRAPYLLAASRAVAEGRLRLDFLSRSSCDSAREQLMSLPGVGRKIADCVLLFACGFQSAFPIDVWIMKALRLLYFPNQHVSVPQLQEFAGSYFGPHAGYAQQYLFHYMRTREQ